MFGERWFNQVMTDLLRSKKAKIAYSEIFEFKREQGRAAIRFYKLASEMGKIVATDASQLKGHMTILIEDPTFIARQECDDPHLFALLVESGARYLFTHDKRLCKCRSEISASKVKNYTHFKVLSNKSVYGKHRTKFF